MKLEKGSFVIMNTTDRAEARLIARVTSIKRIGYRYKIYGKYIGERIASSYGRSKYCWAIRNTLVNPTGGPTPVECFGVTISLCMGINDIMVHKVGESVATYEDGTKREWQDSFDSNNISIAKLRSDYWRLFKD